MSKANITLALLVAQLPEVFSEKRLKFYRSQYDLTILKALKPKLVQLLWLLRKICKASGKQLHLYKQETVDQYLNGIADGKCPVASLFDGDTDQPDVGITKHSRVCGKGGKSKMADSS